LLPFTVHTLAPPRGVHLSMANAVVARMQHMQNLESMREVILTWSLQAQRLRREKGAKRFTWIDPSMSNLSAWQHLWLHAASNNAFDVKRLYFLYWLSAHEAAKQLLRSQMLHAQVIKLRREHKAAAHLLAANKGIDQDSALCAIVFQAWAGVSRRNKVVSGRSSYRGESVSRSAYDSLRC